jgi:hypothetical protein
MKVLDQLSEMKTTEEIENIMTEILPLFYSSVKLKSLPGNFESLVWIFVISQTYFSMIYTYTLPL